VKGSKVLEVAITQALHALREYPGLDNRHRRERVYAACRGLPGGTNAELFLRRQMGDTDIVTAEHPRGDA
jgi:hypothetical protein